MIIKSIYIEKFAGLKNKTIEFNNGINVFYANNEAGKSTISEFIKLILYGQLKSPQNIRDNERKRFIPWGEKNMGGEMVVIKDGVEYIIIRAFGKRKSDDSVNVINAVTGAVAPELCVEAPGEILLHVSREGFEKSLYIHQLGTKIDADKDDEILKKLINLTQSGDEGVSFQRAVQILDSSIKELNGTRPRGKLLLLQDELSTFQSQRVRIINIHQQNDVFKDKLEQLHTQKAQLETTNIDKSNISICRELYANAQGEREVQKRLQEQQVKTNEIELDRLNKATWLSKMQIVIAFILSVILLFTIPFATILTIIWGIICVVQFQKYKKQSTEISAIDISISEKPNAFELQLFELLKINDYSKIPSAIDLMDKNFERLEKEKTAKIISTAEEIASLQNKLENSSVMSTTTIDEMIEQCKEKIQDYNTKIVDINIAKTALQSAFDELQQRFGKQLNENTSVILKEITGGKYSEVFVDEQYNMRVRITDSNELQDAQYLSSGAYDQIYFALRMGIINLLFGEVPIVLDDAFVQYDDTRLKYVLDYIKKVAQNRQILLFSCHKREANFLNISNPL